MYKSDAKEAKLILGTDGYSIIKNSFKLEDCRTWFFKPIEMPLTKDGNGPATVGEDAAKIVYEVWDIFCHSYATFDYLPDAINYSISANLELMKE